MGVILNHIKRERTLTLDHWRYRLLHWTFNIDPNYRYHVPDFLYTHWCPLFHLTNLLVIIAPFTLFFKILGWIFNFIGDSLPARSKPTKEEELIGDFRWYMRRYPEKGLPEFLCNGYWNQYKFTKEEAGQILKSYAKEQRLYQTKKKLLAKKFTLLIRLSELLAKACVWAAVLIACVATFFLSYFVASVLQIVIPAICYHAYANWTDVLLVIGITSIMVGSMCVFGLCLNYFSFRLSQRDLEFPRAKACGVAVESFFSSVGGFVRDLYENNCPPIKLEGENGE